jgi:putative ABC transport system permease protein
MARNVLDDLQLPGQMYALLQHLRYTVRLLRKAPGFTITAVLILGFGIGIDTAIFSLINTVLLKPLPYPNPDRLVEVCMPFREDVLRWADYPDYVDMAAAQHSFESMSVIVLPSTLDLGGMGEAQQVHAYFVSPSLFTLSGLPMKVGRWFTQKEDVPHGPLLAVLTEPFWRSRFQADPAIVGKNIMLSGWSFQVIGVAPVQANVLGSFMADVYVPAHVIETVLNYSLAGRDSHMADCLGRLKPGVSLSQAQAELEAIHNNLIGQYPDTDSGYGLRIVPLSDRVVVDYAQTIWLLGGAAACLLLISGANVANLLYARAMERRREMSIRSALGGSRARLLGQSLLETAFLSVMGGAVGVAIAVLGVQFLKKLCPPDLYRVEQVSVDLNALLFVGAVTTSLAFLAGLLPGLKLSKADVPSVLKAESGRANTAVREFQRTQSFLVVAQVALACALLIGAGLLARSFLAAQSIPLGFNPHQVLTAEVYLTNAKYTSDKVRSRAAFWDDLLARIRQLPGAQVAGMDCNPPLKDGFEVMVPFSVEGQPDLGHGRQPILSWQAVSSDFFRTLQIPLLHGRDFGMQDRFDSQKVMIVDEALAEKYWPGQDAVGKMIKLSGYTGAYTIVGVVPHVRYLRPGQTESGVQAYVPYSQCERHDSVLALRVNGDPRLLVPELRKTIASIDPNVALGATSTYDDLISDTLLSRKLSLLLVTLFSGAALFLAAIGLYAILTYSVSQRRREIGIRIAVGAQTSNIVRLVMQRGLTLVVIGLLLGTLVSLGCSRLIESLLYQVRGNDPITLALAVLALCITAAIACLLPARRAARIDPIVALRQ